MKDESRACYNYTYGGVQKKPRNSNLEMLRIIAMLFIIAHHYVVNSAVQLNFDYSHVTCNMLFLQLFGMWGKTAINVFVLISGYFLCEMRLTWQRWLKVYLQYKLYLIVIFIVLMMIGYEQLTFVGLFKITFSFARNVNGGFFASFLFFYMLVPFYNILIKKLSKKNHAMLIGILLTFFSMFGTFLAAGRVFTESAWYLVLFLVAAYLRKYPPAWSESLKLSVVGLTVSMVIACISVVVSDYFGMTFGGSNLSYYMVADSHKLFAFLVGLFAFLVCKNMRAQHNEVINAIASTAFGVLCIHASSDAMRTMLWVDIVDVPGAYFFPLGELIMYSFFVVLMLFAVCSAIDYVRLRLIERPLFWMINSRTMEWTIEDKSFVKRTLAEYNRIGDA